MTPCVFDCTFLGVPHPVFDFCEGLLDRIEVWRIWRQVPEPGVCGADHLSYSYGLVRAEIVHDDDVAWLKHGDELLLDIGAEAFAVDRSVEDARCGEPITAQRADEGERAPMAVRGEAAQAFAFRPPASQRGHVGLDPVREPRVSLTIDKDQPTRIELSLKGTPALSSARDIGAGLLKSEQRFF